MSEVASVITPTGGNASASVLVSLTQQDVDVLTHVGAPTIEFGGQFTHDAAPVTLAPNTQKLVNHLRVTVVFKDGSTTADNVEIAQSWIADVTAKITAALVAARAEDALIPSGLVSYTAV